MITKEKLRTYRLYLGITVLFASNMVGVTPRTWHRWESGYTPLNEGLVELFILKTKDIYENT